MFTLSIPTAINNIVDTANQVIPETGLIDSGATVATPMATDSIINPIADTAINGATEVSMSFWDLCMEGGILMIPIGILLLFSIYFFIERWLVIRKANRQDDTFMRRIKDYIHEGEIDSALNLCKNVGTPYARLISKGISRIGRPMNDVLVAIENTGNIEIANLSKGLSWLATTASGAPMLGFLGTVIGMVQAFYNISAQGSSADIATFSGGIYTALVTTIAGLIVGVIALFAYNILVAKINNVMTSLEGKTMEFMDLLNEPA